MRIGRTISAAPIDPANLSLSIYVPERNNAQAKLVYAKARLGEVIGVPEGAYHIVSTYLDTVGVGTLGLGKAGRRRQRARAHQLDRFRRCPCRGRQDCRCDPGHRFAKLTIKLVKAPGAARSPTRPLRCSRPGGDIIRELIGAFPSLVLAEGEYVVIARHDAKTYQSTFNVQSGLDQDVEVIAKEDDTQGQ